MPQSPAWPFQNQFPALGANDPIDPNKLKALAAQVAVSADGRIHSDLVTVKNWKWTQVALPEPLAQGTLIHDPKSRRWFAFGNVAFECGFVYTVSGVAWIDGGTLGGSPTLQSSPLSAATNAAGVILVGGAPFSNSTGKLRESTNGGDTWITRNVGLSDQLAVRELAFVPQLGLWLCMVGGLSGATGAGIYTSTDRITWTFRNSVVFSHFVVKDTGSPIIIATTHNMFGASNTYQRSTDGINWAPETGPWPENSTCRGCWCDEHGAFFVGTFSGLWKSATALAGSWTKVNNDTYFGAIGAFGRILMRGDGKASIDAGVTWIEVLELADNENDLQVTAAPGFGVGLARGSSRDLYLSFQIGL